MGGARRADRRSREAGLRAARRRVPQELVAERDQHRLAEVLPRPDRFAPARALRQADGRPRRRHDRRLGPRGRLLRDARPTATRSRPSSATSWSTSWRPSTRRSGSTSGSRSSRNAQRCFILSVEDTMESILYWNTKEGMIFRGGRAPGSTSRRSAPPRSSSPRAASPPGPCPSCAARTPGPARSSRAARLGARPRWSCSTSTTRTSSDFIWCKAREEDKAGRFAEAGFDMSIDGEGFHSIQYQNANNSVRVTQEFLDAVEHGDEWQTTARVSGETGRHARRPRADERDRRGGLALRGPGRPVRHDDQRLAHVPEHRADQRFQPVLPGGRAVHTTLGLIPIGDSVRPGRGRRRFRSTRITRRREAWQLEYRDPARRGDAKRRQADRAAPFLQWAGVRCTPNHRLWTINRGYVAAEELTGEDQVMLNDTPTPADGRLLGASGGGRGQGEVVQSWQHRHVSKAAGCVERGPW